MDHVKISDLAALNDAFGTLGAKVGPRTGPNKRTQDDKEWFVLRRFLTTALSAKLFELPIAISKLPPPAPDFAATHGPSQKAALIEITEATDPSDQREMTEFEKSNENAMLLGAFGGRFSDGASQPKFPWASDIIDAILRKQDKSICISTAQERHLIVYPNSNASRLIFDEDDERDAFSHLKDVIENERPRYADVLSGCQVHVLGKTLVCVDLVGACALISRTRT
jgi:hypothetical protein